MITDAIEAKKCHILTGSRNLEYRRSEMPGYWFIHIHSIKYECLDLKSLLGAIILTRTFFSFINPFASQYILRLALDTGGIVASTRIATLGLSDRLNPSGISDGFLFLKKITSLIPSD